MVGIVFLFLSIFLGDQAMSVIYLVPISILGILLVFAGSQLALTIIDLKHKKDLFVALIILGITIATNLAAGFISGIAIAYILKNEKINI